MKREDIESWVRAIKEKPIQSIGLLLAALLIVAGFSFAGEIGKSLARLGDGDASISGTQSEQPAVDPEQVQAFEDLVKRLGTLTDPARPEGD